MKLLLQTLKLKGSRMLLRPVTWRPDLKVWRHWLRPGITWIRLVLGKVSRSKIIQLATFAKECVAIGKCNGRKGLVLYLKVCNTALMQALPGGFLHHNSREIGKVAVARTRDGLPRIIPAFARREIRLGNKETIQLWLTFLGAYRVMPCKGRPKFSTILDLGRPLSPSFLNSWKAFVRSTFIPGIQAHSGVQLLDKGTSLLERPLPFVIASMSADKREDPFMSKTRSQYLLAGKALPETLRGVPTSFAHRFNAAKLWRDGEWAKTPPNLLEDYLKEVPGGFGTTKSLWTLLLETADFYPAVRHMHRAQPVVAVPPSGGKGRFTLTEDPESRGSQVLPNAHPTGKDACGRLALLEEAAGKVRVVALLDCWSQWALKPLHNWIFSILEGIPQDGTFDQLRPIKRLLKKVGNDTTIYSYDLSAATDRIPVVIQEILLAQVFGEGFAKAWRNLLVGRPYWVSKRVQRERGLASPALFYGTGQPMGGYSSWAMLALTHHVMVQFCAYRCGIRGWFGLYAVLGDDIVIADNRVSQKYRALCRLLGVDIGLNKSLVAKGKTLEFAKKLFFQGEDISGLPLKYWAAAQSSSGVAASLGTWVTRGSLSNFVRAMGGGFKICARVADTLWENLPKRARALAVTLTHPLIGSRFAYNTWPEWLWSRSASDRGLNPDMLTDLTPFCTAVQEVLVKPAMETLEDYQEALFFTEKVEDGVTRIVDATSNKAVVDATRSIELAEKSLRHLQGLSIKMNLVQVSAIVSQIWKSVDRAGLVPMPSVKATARVDVDPYRLKVTNMLRHFVWLRSLAHPQLPGTGAVVNVPKVPKGTEPGNRNGNK